MFGPKTTVLVVDDLHGTRKHLVKVLGDIGFTHVVEAADGEKAWDMLGGALNVGLIISDWNMPNMNGLDLLKKVRGTPTTANIPFLLVTAESEIEKITEAVKAGVDNYIRKPFTVQTLTEKLQAIEKKRG
jgi:two-component system chemotaxis response regulator CheY